MIATLVKLLMVNLLTVKLPTVKPLMAKLLSALVALLFCLSASAGSVSFVLSLTGSQLGVINQGDSSAFYPAVYRLLPDGRWERLAAAMDTPETPAELAAGARLQLIWPNSSAPDKAAEFERIQPIMVRFFDQAGVGFGQISLFSPPPIARNAPQARYVNGALQIEPPESASRIRASWVLWPEEDGIGPIRLPVRFEHRPPPAQRIDWQRQGRLPFRIVTGAGQPAVTLLHDSGQGYTLQSVPGGGLQGREQRAAWLDATQVFYAAALIALLLAAGAMLLQFLRRPKQTPATAEGKLSSAQP